MTLPRLVIAAPASGHGKTTVATGLMAALRTAGHRVSGHKVGPDYIDAGYHSLATGRAGRSLDAHLVGPELLAPLLVHGASSPYPADLAVVEGVMGLFDGALGREGFASTAHVATVLQAPVVLVVDVSHASRTVAAVVHGLATFDPAVRVAGVVLNKAGSSRHAAEAASAVRHTGVPVLGVLHRDDGVAAPSRHLGLVPADERADAQRSLGRLADQVARHVDLDQVVRIAHSAPPLPVPAWDPSGALGPSAADSDDASPLVAIAGGRAFTFRYAETEELLQAAGLRTAVFDPLADEALPDGTAGLYLGGGFPEVHAAGLSANSAMRTALAAALDAGVPAVAECAGLLYLCRTLDGSPMVGAVPADAVMTGRLTLGYRTATAPTDTLLAEAGSRVTAHEFHRTATRGEPRTPAWDLASQPGQAEGYSLDPAGLGRATVHASYLHTHWAGHPQLAARFATAVRRAAPLVATRRTPARRKATSPSGIGHRPASADVDLHHHGDQEATLGLVDLAVNVSAAPRPGWLEEALADSLAQVGRYPDSTAAREAIAARHLRPPEEVLPTAGGAEAFTLLARLRRWRHPVVVHPQFTEPEAALRACGHEVGRVLLREDEGFVLDPEAVPDDADLVVVGNPTNPTGVLHPAATLDRLARPGRLLVVDEAFLDAVPGEPESLADRRAAGVVVVRSLTKTWSIPGVRAGYLLGDSATLRELATHQPPWSVSTTAAAAMVACCTPQARAETQRRAEALLAPQRLLVEGLLALGLSVPASTVAPFVLARGPVGLREALRDEGFAVRRGDTFPGLGPEWIRIAVRDTTTTRRLLTAIAGCTAEVQHV